MTDSRFRFLYEFNGELIPRTRSEDSSTLKSLLLDDVIQAVVAPFIEKTFELTTVDLSHLKVYRSSLEEMNHILENQHRHVPFSPALGEEIKNLERIVEYNIVIWRDVNAGNATALYRKAWGERWPQRQEIILKTQIGEPDDYDDGYPYPGAYADIPDHFTYVCLDQMHEVAKNLYLSTKLNDIIVVRKEYEWLCDRLEKTAEDLVITGHPGIGKTTFLLYLLLYRLQRKLPTAIQLGPEYFFIFDEQGGQAYNPKKYDKKRLEKCWALSDSNSGIGEPCIAFQTHAHRVIQASSPKPRRWKEWLKQKEGTRIVSDLPEVLEIAAVLKELKHDTSRTLSLVGQWGPSIRTIAKIISEPTFIEQLEIDAERVAMAIYASPPTFFSTLNTGEIPTSEGSPVLFLRPRRGNAPGANNVVSSSQSQFFILTKFLTDLFDNHRSKLENKTSLELFCAFASHSFTRTAAGWLHEQNMHSRMCASGLALDIFADSKSMQMQPSSLLLSGTTASFNHRGVTRSFYWIPSAINFPGIDAVLRDRKNLFALQASIANDHKTPLEGIQKVWKEASSTIQKNCTWHFVIIAENISTAKSLRAKFLKELDGLMLGNARVPVQVWYCVL